MIAKIWLTAFVSLIFLALLASGVAAQADFLFGDGYEALCNEGVPERMWVNGNVLQIRGQINRSRTYMPIFDETFGTNVSIVNVRLDVTTGDGTVWGTFTSTPDEIDGTLEGSFSGRLIGGLYFGRGVGHGTGELAGMQLKTVTEEIPYDPELMPPGSCPSGIDPPTMLHNEMRVLAPKGD